MKFGKQIQRRQLDIPEYAASFVNYKLLKKLIKQLSATPTLSAQNVSSFAPADLFSGPQTSLQANRATFFFKLDREVEKVNAFYLQKEAELKLRLKTLLEKKRVLQATDNATSKFSANFLALEEGFQQFGGDLNKLQQFVDINATAFSKILKKWDKTSKSRTKELYISRAVEVQPCFNRDVISDLSDQATTSLLELGAWAEGEKVHFVFSSRRSGFGQAFTAEDTDADSQLLRAAITDNLVILKEWAAKMRAAPDAKERFTRAFLAAIPDAPPDALAILLETELVDLRAEDEINGRNCLHEAAISGNSKIFAVGLTEGVDPSRMDLYGRIPLHYACMHGQVSMVRALLDKQPATVDSADHDNFTPLIHAIVHKRLDCAEQLLSRGARIDPANDTDHIPLNLACQHGAIDIVRLLLEKGAKVLPDAEGLYPQHIIARKGDCSFAMRVLREFGANLNQQDKVYQWTPLFHAASEGSEECVKTLLEENADVGILDEKALSATYYATWEGHLVCMDLLAAAGGASGVVLLQPAPTLADIQTVQKQELHRSGIDVDGIPDLSLPPPIIPLRRYGHNFLDTKALIQITFDTCGSGAVLFYNDSRYPAARLTITSKSSDFIPRNVILPVQEELKSISFQVDSLESFSLDFDVFPTFGAKVIARTVALPSTFNSKRHSFGHCYLPLYDPRLRAIGQVNFGFQVIKPFHGIPLEIAQFETYWKATSHLDNYPSTLVTGSSLFGDYVQVFVQVSADGVPFLHPRWSVNYCGLDITLMRTTISQLTLLANGRDRSACSFLSSSQRVAPARIHREVSESLASLRNVLSLLHPDVRVNIHVLYPSIAEDQRLGLSPVMNINDYVDSILTDVFDHAREIRRQRTNFTRPIVFTSNNPNICIALNWKQPNYPVLLCNDLGGVENLSNPQLAGSCDGLQAMSMKEAVRLSQMNNFMGLICTSKILGMVPALVEAIKVAGLVLVRKAGDSHNTALAGVDGVLQDYGVLRFNEAIDI